MTLDRCADYLRDPWTPVEMELPILRLLRVMDERNTFEWGRLQLVGSPLSGPAVAAATRHLRDRSASNAVVSPQRAHDAGGAFLRQVGARARTPE